LLASTTKAMRTGVRKIDLRAVLTVKGWIDETSIQVRERLTAAGDAS